jgi:hypothetical protein
MTQREHRTLRRTLIDYAADNGRRVRPLSLFIGGAYSIETRIASKRNLISFDAERAMR